MKAIYLNLDPYLQAVADWLNAGKPGTAPSFNPLPVAVTIPLGEAAGIIINGNSSGTQAVSIDGVDIGIFTNASLDPPTPPEGESILDDNYVCNLSKFKTESPQPYSIFSVSGDLADQHFVLTDEDDNIVAEFTIPVLVRRETASGPVDLVDFTPPLSLAGVSFAGVDIEGAEFDGNEIVAAADTGALSAPAGA